jgi:hypothetical protein
MGLREKHEAGLDVLGAGLGLSDFVPWLGAVGKIAGGLTGGGSDTSTKDAIAKAVAAEKQKQEIAKAQAEAAKTRAILYVALGVVGVAGLGTAMYFITRKK